MFKKVIFLVVLVLGFALAPARGVEPVETSLLSDSFENPTWDVNWDANATNWVRSAGDGNSHSGTYSAESTNLMQGDLICNDFNTSDAAIIKLDFWFYDTGMGDNDFQPMALRDGSVWQVIRPDLATMTPAGTWNHYSCGFIDSNYFDPNFQINLYSSALGTDYLWVDDVNISKIVADTYDVILLDDGFESTPFDANWNDVANNWVEGVVVKSGASSAAGTDVNQGLFVCDALDTSDAAAVKVDFWLYKTNLDDTGLAVYYRSTDGWEFAGHLTDAWADDVWVHFEEVLVESKYFHPDFQLEFFCTIAAGEGPLYIDDVLITKRVIKTSYASVPNPSDGATGISVSQQLRWKAGFGATNHAVYFGTSKALIDANDASVYKGTVNVPDPCEWSPALIADETYYWRIDANAPVVYQGEVWSFSTKTSEAKNPDPWDGSKHVNLSKTLSWTAGDGSEEHTVYFGTDETLVADSCDLVFKTTINAGDPCEYTPDPCLAGATLYYWKIDSNTGTIFTEGDVWSFKTARALELIDPNLVGWWPMTEKFGTSIVWDTSGNEHHGTLVGDNVDIVTDGVRGHALELTNPAYATLNSVVDCGGDATDGGWADIRETITFMCWFTMESNWNGGNFLIAKGSAYQFRGNGPPTNSIEINMEGLDDPLQNSTGEQLIMDGFWHHIAATYDANAASPPGERKLYIDGKVLDGTEGTEAPTGLLQVHPETFVIGGRLNPSLNDRGWDGRVGDVRLYNRALSASEIDDIYNIRDDPNKAWEPYPFSGAVDVADRPLTLTWRKGDDAMGSGLHRVYFGTDQALVDACDVSVDNGPQDVNYLDVGELPFATPYYWRVDETDGVTVWRGLDWTFTMANFHRFEDFESYNPDPIIDTWIRDEDTGALVSLGSLDNEHPVNGGEQSMKYAYDNDDPTANLYYSEVYRDFGGSPWDWTWATGGVKSMRLYFYGETGNYPDDMYVVLEDSNTNDFMKLYDGDLSDVNAGEWKEWDIALSDFTTVHLGYIKKIYIGFGTRGNDMGVLTRLTGTVYFDDFRVYPPHCVPSEAPAAALLSGNDCLIDEKDVDAMTADWLDRDYIIATPLNPGDANLLACWNFDDGTANDSGPGGHHGTMAQGVSIVYDAVRDSNVAYFPGGEGNDISCGGGGADTWADDMEQISIAAWVQIDEYTTEYQYIAAKQGSWRIMRYDTTNSPRFYTEYTEGSDQSLLGYTDIQGGEWHHICGVSDGTTKYIYIDGLMENSVTREGGIDNSDPNIIIGGTERTDSLHRMWKGFIDDVRLYDDALTQAEVMFLAGHTGPAYNPIYSPANLTDAGDPCNSRFVNYKDFNIIADGWLTDTYWP